jgi:hypothetical protein
LGPSLLPATQLSCQQHTAIPQVLAVETIYELSMLYTGELESLRNEGIVQSFIAAGRHHSAFNALISNL